MCVFVGDIGVEDHDITHFPEFLQDFNFRNICLNNVHDLNYLRFIAHEKAQHEEYRVRKD